MRLSLRAMGRGLALAALALPAWLASPSASACEKTLRRNPDAPHLVRLNGGERTGPLQAVLTEALQRMGCRVTVVDLPWARALADLQSGQLDVLPGTRRTPEREAFAWFSTEERVSSNRLYLRADDPRRDTLRTLDELPVQRFVIGVQRQVSYGAEFDALMQQPAFARQVQTVARRESLWRMLALGRLDGVLADDTMAGVELDRLGLSDRIVPSTVQTVGVSTTTAFSRRSTDADFVRRFDRTLQAMRADGSLAAIEQRVIDAQNRALARPPQPAR